MNAIDTKAPPSGAGGRLILDISRLLSRAGEAVPTGIDRVELAWAEYLLAHEAGRLEFAAIHPLGPANTLPFKVARRFIEALSAAWGSGAPGRRAGRLRQRLLHGLLLPRPPRATATPRTGQATYLLLSHQNLNRPGIIAKALRRHRARFVPMVHDLIPIEYPEYCAAKQPQRHRLRMATVAQLADAVIVPSDAVRQTLLAHLETSPRRAPKIHVVPNGVHLREVADHEGIPLTDMTGAASRPYFVCLGTIEPRKNHALLLMVWRRLAALHGHNAPRLVLIGRRGWESEHVHRLLDRSPMLKGLVEEHNALPDREVVRLLRGARALLYPSFAEGFGLPVAEALALGVPVICSDIPVHREVGGDAAIYLDAIDGNGWLDAVNDHTRSDRPAAARPPAVANAWPLIVRHAVQLIDANGHPASLMTPGPVVSS